MSSSLMNLSIILIVTHKSLSLALPSSLLQSYISRDWQSKCSLVCFYYIILISMHRPIRINLYFPGVLSSLTFLILSSYLLFIPLNIFSFWELRFFLLPVTVEPIQTHFTKWIHWLKQIIWFGLRFHPVPQAVLSRIWFHCTSLFYLSQNELHQSLHTVATKATAHPSSW